MTKLSVNINKIATLRNARGGEKPDLTKFAIDCESYGADGITVHPRPDERHVKKQDLFDLKHVIKTEYNIEGYPTKDFLNTVINIKPTQVTLVPDNPEALTSDRGWDMTKDFNFLVDVNKELKKNNIRTSIFVEPNVEDIYLAKKINFDRIELYTGHYAKNFSSNKNSAVKSYKLAAEKANELELEINAGHDLDLYNLCYFKQNIHFLSEVSIGHALICDSLYYGIESTIKKYKEKLL